MISQRQSLVARGVRQLGVVIGLAVICVTSAAHSESYPTRPIHIIVPQLAGGANDIVARLLQPRLEQALGQPIVVENRSGASGVVGSDVVAKATPDGYTLGITFATLTVNPAVNAHMPFDTEHDLAPVILIGKNPLLFLVNAKLPVKTLPELVAFAKANPGKLNYATPGAASQAHLLMADLCRRAGIEMQNLPYRGGAPAILATVAGEAQLALISPLASNAQIQAGTLRPIATGSAERDKQFPDLADRCRNISRVRGRGLDRRVHDRRRAARGHRPAQRRVQPHHPHPRHCGKARPAGRHGDGRHAGAVRRADFLGD